MNKGYRLSASIAYYNYYQDKTANFGIADNAGSLWNNVKGAANYIDDLAQGVGRNTGQTIRNAGQKAVINSVDSFDNINPLLYHPGQVGVKYGSHIGSGGRYGKLARRVIGYGTGAATVGAGYSAYRGLTGN